MTTAIEALIQGICLGAVYALISLSLSLVYQTSKIFNMAHGDLVVTSFYILFAVERSVGGNSYLWIPVTAIAMAMIGFAVWQLFSRTLTASPIIITQITIGLLFVIENMLNMIFSPSLYSVQAGVTGQFSFSGVVISQWLVIAFVVAVVLSVVIFYVLSRTVIGQQIRAVAEDRELAATSGIRVRRIQMGTFVVSLALIGLISPVIVQEFTLTPTLGLSLTVIALSAMVLGGVDNLLGCIVAGVALGVVTGLVSQYVNLSMGAVAPYAFLMVVLILRPQGLLGRRSSSRN